LYRPEHYYKPPDSTLGMNRGFYFDQTFYLPGDILVKVDRAAMANGLETRSPFLDRDVVEFAQSLPATLKVKGDETKIVQRRACEQYWPEELRGRGKQGFGAPTGPWLERADVKALVQRVFGTTSQLRQLLPGIKVPRGAEPPYQTWILLVLGLWLENCQVAV
jgi:asparagine synthase (glutamine-hydrolysing)